MCKLPITKKCKKKDNVDSLSFEVVLAYLSTTELLGGGEEWAEGGRVSVHGEQSAVHTAHVSIDT